MQLRTLEVELTNRYYKTARYQGRWCEGTDDQHGMGNENLAKHAILMPALSIQLVAHPSHTC